MSKLLPEPEYFTTFDIHLASTLLCLDFPLASLNRDNPKKVEFIFQDTDVLSEAIENFWLGNIRVEPKALLTSLKTLKNRLYSSQ